MEYEFNSKSTAVKRLMSEAKELAEPTDEYSAHPLEDNLFEWHFTMRGPHASEFDGGIYHGRILFPTEYPMKPPSIILLTPNGRWETNKKICLSITGYHPETWQPSWSIRTSILALIAFMTTNDLDSVGALECTPEERQFLALKSRDWICDCCGEISNLLANKKEVEVEVYYNRCVNVIEAIHSMTLGDYSNDKALFTSPLNTSDKIFIISKGPCQLDGPFPEKIIDDKNRLNIITQKVKAV
ncbi:unnamed protein product [Macrosiphum euphorbiae]|uniref:UBC core domain-containing protein n=1 Tax=Macrosiphum euphorbiae TaxID=13131 RepID=A0AAV0W3W1_9HEMI|nr:unnamed protein product [Macrosiphum euphorbiae]